jgi:hypothetical protein
MERFMSRPWHHGDGETTKTFCPTERKFAQRLGYDGLVIRAIIFDLDNCLGAADEVGRGLLKPVFDAIRRANKGTLSDGALAQAFEDCWRRPLDRVAREYGFSDEMLDAGWEVAVGAEVEAPCAAIQTSPCWGNSTRSCCL